MLIKNDREIRQMSDSELLSGIKSLVQKEKNYTLSVLKHLKEIEHRKLFFAISVTARSTLIAFII